MVSFVTIFSRICIELVTIPGSEVVRPPKAFGAADVELGHIHGELEAFLAADTADLETAAGAPVFAGLFTSNRGIQGRAEGFEDVDLEGALGRVAGLVVGHVGDVVGAPLEGLAGFEAALVDHAVDLDVVGEDGLVPCDDGGAELWKREGLIICMLPWH